MKSGQEPGFESELLRTVIHEETFDFSRLTIVAISKIESGLLGTIFIDHEDEIFN
jgi:hypothetical protein